MNEISGFGIVLLFIIGGLGFVLIMLLIAILPIIYGERAYHALKNRNEKNLVMAAIICFTLIDIVILINDLLEADKVGPFYFLSLSIIVFFYVKSQKDGNSMENELKVLD